MPDGQSSNADLAQSGLLPEHDAESLSVRERVVAEALWEDYLRGYPGLRPLTLALAMRGGSRKAFAVGDARQIARKSRLVVAALGKAGAFS